MIDDSRLLGIDETGDLALVKRAFRRRAKELHPDLAGEAEVLSRHDQFAELCRAYRRLLARLGRDGPVAESALPGSEAKPPSSGSSPPSPLRATGRPASPSSQAERGLVSHADQAWVFYRSGMKQFMRIHPSQWNLDSGRMLNTKIAGADEEQETIRRRVLELVKLFPRAYYYLSLVVHEYPESPWAADAREKMELIESRIGRYRKIIESFSNWNLDQKAAIRDYHERYAAHAATRRAVRDDRPEDWGGGDR